MTNPQSPSLRFFYSVVVLSVFAFAAPTLSVEQQFQTSHESPDLSSFCWAMATVPSNPPRPGRK
jgi:hypothetical protein